MNWRFVVLPERKEYMVQDLFFFGLVGHSSLSWITRVQIALDAARAIEYIHEHTKTRYVHQGIKTSNILLDASFRAKVLTNLDTVKLVVKVLQLC